jgi:hypothetical protein
LLILILAITYFIPKTAEMCSPGPDGVVCGPVEANGIGYPIFYGDKFRGDVIYTGFYPLNFLINIAVYYLFSSIIVFGLKNLKKN